ncbi:hypothetical protein [Marimonas arenosa]|uniref:Uncharacterized protein n=1 Tax=Marimonas arenosa TaxID=1795305 RepID=A0AAE3WBJ1_9RHOB|nr:hypothetical protein [Marimonas arenosa]MDQ2088772.1 hypothetical protein [Marimonas arenosa]
MINLRHFLRMSRWARRPPPAWRIKLVLTVIVLALLIAGVERFIGWPDVLTLDPKQPRRLPTN